MNIVRARQIIKAFINKLVIYQTKALTHNLCHFPNLNGNEIDSKLQTFIVNHLFFLHDNFQTRFENPMQLNIPSIVNFLHTMAIEDEMDQTEFIQIKLCSAIAYENDKN